MSKIIWKWMLNSEIDFTTGKIQKQIRGRRYEANANKGIHFRVLIIIDCVICIMIKTSIINQWIIIWHCY